MSSLTLQDVAFTYYKSQHMIQYGSRVIVSGSQIAVTGASGSGKTTLLHLLAGILRPNQGQILRDNRPYSQLSPSELDMNRRQGVSMIFQKPHLIESLSVLDNLRAIAFFRNIAVSDNRYLELLSKLNLLDCKSKKPRQLSQGQAHRVAIARAFICAPTLLLADEPTASLDDSNTNEAMLLLLQECKERNTTLVIATHDSRVKVFFDQIWTL